MPIEEKSSGCYHVHNTTTKKCLSKEKAKKQLAAIEINKNKQESRIAYRGHIYEVSDETSKYYLCDLLANKTLKFIMSFSTLLFRSNEINDPREDVSKEEFSNIFKVNGRQKNQYDYLKKSPYDKYKVTNENYGTFYYIPLQDIFNKEVINKLKKIKADDPYLVNQVPSILKIIGNVRLKLVGGSRNDKGFFCLDFPSIPNVNTKCDGAAIDKHGILYVPFLDPSTNKPLPLTRYYSDLQNSLIHEFRHLYDLIVDNVDISYDEKSEESLSNNKYKNYLMRPTERNAHFETMAADIEKYIVRRIKDVNRLYNTTIKPDEKYGPRQSIKEDPWDHNEYVEQRNYLIDLMTNANSFLHFIDDHYDIIFPDNSSRNFYQLSKIEPEIKKELVKKIVDIFNDMKLKYKNILPVKKYSKHTSNYVDEELKNGNK